MTGSQEQQCRVATLTLKGSAHEVDAHMVRFLRCSAHCQTMICINAVRL